ncbi:MAG: radical SAM protein, partial [Gemmatimonadota bacterium]|nr:radical SAM protein [Gemmatimonadota bacterium]
MSRTQVTREVPATVPRPSAPTVDPGVRGHVRHLYVHAPFCRRRCVYCDFAVHVSGDPGSEGWENVVAKEWQLWKEAGVTTTPDLRTVYVGGGTPSVLPEDAIPRFATSIGLTGAPDGSLEWTVEANPESFSGALASAWARAGVNRISLGVQTFSPHGLRWMGRLHGPADVTSALLHARRAGITNLSV